MSPSEIAEKREELARHLEGTCLSLDTAIERLELDTPLYAGIDWEDEMLTFGMELCLGCGWWMESCELVHERDEDTGYCDQCIDTEEDDE